MPVMKCEYCEYIKRQRRYYNKRIRTAKKPSALGWWMERLSQLEQDEFLHQLRDH